MACEIRGCGTYRGYPNGCRCIESRAAWANYRAEQRRGLHKRMPAAPVRRRIAQLHETLTYREIAERAGLYESGVMRIVYGEYATVERRTHDAIMGIAVPGKNSVGPVVVLDRKKIAAETVGRPIKSYPQALRRMLNRINAGQECVTLATADTIAGTFGLHLDEITIREAT